MINFSKFNSLYSVAMYFNTESMCQQAIVESRWGDDVVCPYCGKHHCNKRADGRWCCSQCNKNFSEKVGTIFENTKIGLRKWFMAMYLISTHKKGISSHQLAKDIEVTQKTAWFILQKIRTLFSQDDSTALSGDVECDEAYIGGREQNKHEWKKIKGYLQRYVDEAVYRYNTRKTSGCDCFKQMFAKSIGVVDYKAVQMFEMVA